MSSLFLFLLLLLLLLRCLAYSTSTHGPFVIHLNYEVCVLGSAACMHVYVLHIFNYLSACVCLLAMSVRETSYTKKYTTASSFLRSVEYYFTYTNDDEPPHSNLRFAAPDCNNTHTKHQTHHTSNKMRNNCWLIFFPFSYTVYTRGYAFYKMHCRLMQILCYFSYHHAKLAMACELSANAMEFKK